MPRQHLPLTDGRVCAEGIPFEKRRARQMTRQDYETYDYILLMDENNRRNLMRIIGSDPAGKVHKLLDFSERPRDIADPWYTGNFDVTYDDIEEGCQAFLQYITK